MSIEFREVTFAPLQHLSVSASSGAFIGLTGSLEGGAAELIHLALGQRQPEAGEVLREGSIVCEFQLGQLDAIRANLRLLELEKARRTGATVFLFTQDPQLMDRFCDEVWWVDDGKLRQKGDPREVMNAWLREAGVRMRQMASGMPLAVHPVFRRGDGRAELTGLELKDSAGQENLSFASGQDMEVVARFRYKEAVSDPVIGIMLRTRIGVEVFGTNTELEGVRVGPCEPGATRRVSFRFCCQLCPGEYTLTVASHDPDGVWHDWLEDAVAFQVTDHRYTAGVANLRALVKASD
jgi:hypothetical protein